MLKAGWEVTVSNAVDLFAAVRAGDAASVARMVELEPALLQARNEQGVSAVLMACYMGRKEIRDLLIERGAILQLHEAAAAGNLSRVRELVEGKADLAKSHSPDGFPVMALAAAFGHEDVVRYLHGAGADVNAVATNGTGYTALTGAVAGSHASLAKWLAERFPKELASRLPRKRRPWDSEAHSMDIFEAVALALAFRLKNERRTG